MNTKAVIFDMDGVLVNSRQGHYQAWKESGEKYGFSITLEKYNKYFGQTSELFARAICKENGVEDVDEVIKDWLKNKDICYRESFKGNYKENPSVTNLVKSLNESGFKTGIGSSAPRSNVQDLVDVMPNGELLKEFVTGDDVIEGKPNPEVFLKVADKLGVLAKRCAVIEDSVHGISAAKSAGMVAIGITGTHDRETLAECADMVIEDLNEVDAQRICSLIDS